MLECIAEHFVVIDQQYSSRADKICDYLESLSGYKFLLHIESDSHFVLRTNALNKTASPGILDGLARLEIIDLRQQEGREAKFFVVTAADFFRLETRALARSTENSEKNKIERIIELFKQAYSFAIIQDFVSYDGLSYSASRPYWHIRTSKSYLKADLKPDCNILRYLKANGLIEFDRKDYEVISTDNARKIYYQIIIAVKEYNELEVFLENKARKSTSLASLQRSSFWRRNVIAISNPEVESDADTDSDNFDRSF